MNRTAIKFLTTSAATVSLGALLAAGNAGASVQDKTRQQATADRSWRAIPPPRSVSPPGQEALRLVKEFSDFAGSYMNATSLVMGLRSGSTVTLSDNGSSGGAPIEGIVQFTPPDAFADWGHVRQALSLARAELTAHGIANPTPTQIEAALMGLSANTPGDGAALPGILALRSQGMGWGQIGQRLGMSPNVPATTVSPFQYSGQHGLQASATNNPDGRSIAPTATTPIAEAAANL